MFRGGLSMVPEARLLEQFMKEHGTPGRVPRTAEEFAGDLVLMTNTLLRTVTGKAIPPVWLDYDLKALTVGQHIARADTV